MRGGLRVLVCAAGALAPVASRAAALPSAARDAAPPVGARVLAPPLLLDTDEGRREHREAIEKGLAFLAESQSREHGHVGDMYRVAVTSLAGLAFLGNGYGVDRGRYGDNVARCLAYIMDSARTEVFPGFLARAGDNHPMHGHCFALLFLTQVYGELPSRAQRDVEVVIRRGIDVIKTARSSRGGWYYGPRNEGDQDENSVTAGVLQALRAARNVGFAVEQYLIEGAETYLENCQKADGSFRYQLRPEVTWSTYELTCASVAGLQALGRYATPQVKLGVDFMRRAVAEAPGQPLDAARQYRFYGNFYAAQVFYTEGGDAWRSWHMRAFRQLIDEGRRTQWRWQSRFGEAYATAMAVLILEVPLGYLPIFQR